MKWYFALNGAALEDDRDFWESMILAAVHSAAEMTTLKPHFLYDGSPDDPFLEDLRGLGVEIVPHRVTFADALLAHATSDPMYARIALGAFLRTEISLVERSDQHVLYTDCDILFRGDPCQDVRLPDVFSCAPEFYRNDDVNFNTGVMLMNLDALRDDLPEFTEFIQANLERFATFDQDAYRQYYAGKAERLPDTLNWKPYWGADGRARIVHFHGPKPSLARRLLSAPQDEPASDLSLIFNWNREGYAHYVSEWERTVARAKRARARRPTSPASVRPPSTRPSIAAIRQRLDAMEADRGAPPTIRRCSSPTAGASVVASLPNVDLLTDAIFIPKVPGVPYEESSGWGVYHSDGRLCESAAYKRGGSGYLGHESFTSVRPTKSLPSKEIYVYAGPCHLHYGHVIVATLARLWLPIAAGRSVRFLFHGDATPKNWFRLPYFDEIMSALGLYDYDFVNLKNAYRVPHLIVPGPAFQELLDAHSVFGELGCRVGNALLPAPTSEPQGAIYLSKSRLDHGIWRVTNELELETELERLGVEIVHPETLTVAEQIEKLESADIVLGTMGSALHTSIFARHPLKIRALSVTADVVTNYTLIDNIKQNDAIYYQALDTHIPAQVPEFTLQVKIRDPVKVAREYLRDSLS